MPGKRKEEGPMVSFSVTKYSMQAYVNGDLVPPIDDCAREFEIRGEAFLPDGPVKGAIVCRGLIVSEDAMILQADEYSQAAYDAAEEFAAPDGSLMLRYSAGIGETVILVTQLEVKEELRGQGLGTCFLENLPELANELSELWDAILLNAVPYAVRDASEIPDAESRLIRLYKRAGFHQKRGTNSFFMKNPAG